MEEQQRQLNQSRVGLARSATESGNSSSAYLNTSDSSIKDGCGVDQTQNLSILVDGQEIKDMFIAHTSPTIRKLSSSKDKSLMQNVPKTPNMHKSLMHKSISSPAALLSAAEEGENGFFNNSITPVRRFKKKSRKMIGDSDSDSDWSYSEEFLFGGGADGLKKGSSMQKFRSLGGSAVRKAPSFQPNKSVQENIQNMLVADEKPRYDSSVLFQNKPSLRGARGRRGLGGLGPSLSKSRKSLPSDKGSVLLEPDDEVNIEEVDSPVYQAVKRKFKRYGKAIIRPQP